VSLDNFSTNSDRFYFCIINLDYAGTALSTRNDVDDAYSFGIVEYYSSYTDPGLEEAYLQYKSEVFDPNKLGYIKDRGLSGEIELRRYSPDPPEWVYSEARLAVDEISLQIKNDVHLDQQINYENYPNPADAMSATALDLVPKIKVNQTGYVDKASYVNNDGVYLSASAKVISQVREWYVDEVVYQVNKTYLGAAENPSSKTFIPLSLQNINVFADVAVNTYPLRNGGQQVLPPTPNTVWLMTTNFWKVRVKGTIDELTIIDADN
jgi:hypothetical protein